MELRSNLQRYQMVIFPKKPVDHYDIATPFEIYENQVFDRKINRKVQKEGLGVSWEDFEQNRKIIKPKSFFDLVELLVKSKNAKASQKRETSRGMKLWNRFKDIISEGRRINVDVKGISRQKLSVPTLKYVILPYFSKSKKFVYMYRQMEYDTKVLENEVRRYRE